MQFHCQQCEELIGFSVLKRDLFSKKICCKSCGQKYVFDDETLVRHLKQFEALCQQIYASEEILGSSSIAIDIGNHRVKVPFNILLTKLSSVMDLHLNGKKLSILFRVEPLKDVPEILNSSAVKPPS